MRFLAGVLVGWFAGLWCLDWQLRRQLLRELDESARELRALAASLR